MSCHDCADACTTESAVAEGMSAFVGLMTLESGSEESSQCAWTTPVFVALARVRRMNAEAGLTSESAKTKAPRAVRAIRIRLDFMVYRPPLLGWGVGVDLDLAVNVQGGLDAVEERVQGLIRSRGRGDLLAVLGEQLGSCEVVTHLLHAVLAGYDRVLALLESHHPRIARPVLLGEEHDDFLALLEAGHPGHDRCDVAHGAADLTEGDRGLALVALHGLDHAQREE